MILCDDPTRLPQCDVLAFGPHPDDIEIACAGTLLRLQAAGCRVALVDLTRGEMGSRGTVEDRDREAEAAAIALGVEARCNLGIADTGVSTDDDATRRCVVAMRTARPRVVFAPHRRDRHPDHAAAAELIVRAHFLSGLRNWQPDAGAAHRARTLLHYPGNHPVEPTFVVDISTVVDHKADVVRCYASQLAPPDKSHLVQGLDLFDRTIVRQQGYGAMIATAAGEGFTHDGPLAIDEFGWLIG